MKGAFLPLLMAIAAAAPAVEWNAASQPAEDVGGLIGSKHDFAPRGAPLVEHCIACHGRPDAAATSPTRQRGSSSYDTNPKRQRGPFANAVPSSFPADAFRYSAFGFRLSNSTLLCLSCHDGTLSSFISANEINPAPPHAQIDFAHDHPVGIAYPRSNRRYRPAALVEQRGVRLPDGRVECISCHDPHDALRIPDMLVNSNRRSALCLTCHIK